VGKNSRERGEGGKGRGEKIWGNFCGQKFPHPPSKNFVPSK